MSGETAKQESGWTTDTLKAYVDRRFENTENAIEVALVAHEKHVQAQIASVITLINKNDEAQKQRFTASQLAIDKSDMAGEKRFESVNEFRAQLADQARTFLPRAEYDARHETLESRVSEITNRLNRSEGQTRGSDITMSKIYAAIGAVGALLGVLVLLANGVFN